MTAACGTYAGWNQHQAKGTPICLECREAARQYQAERRKRDREVYRREKAKDNARVRALWRLAKLHPNVFKALVADEETKDRAQRLVDTRPVHPVRRAG